MSASHGNIASKQSKSMKQRHSSFNSDNGGFEMQNTPANSRSTQHISVRERLRSSFDKLSFKSFIWGSSEKVCSNKAKQVKQGIGHSTPKKKSDKDHIFKKKHKTKNESDENFTSKQKKKDKLHLHKVLATKKVDKNQLKSEKKTVKYSSNIACSHNFENKNSDEAFVDYPSPSANVSKTQKRTVCENPAQVKSIKTNKSRRESNEAYLTVSSDYSDLNRAAAITRAKESWSTLRDKNAQPSRYKPVKASSKHHQPVFYVAGSSSMDVLPSSVTAERLNKAHENNKLVPNQNKVGSSSSSIDLSAKSRSPMKKQNINVLASEPPKIAPVSGMYLSQNPFDSIVLRPTAFKVVAKRNKVKNPVNDCNALSKYQNKTANQDINYSQRKSSASESNSDSGLLCSGRNSSDSNEATKTSPENEACISSKRKSANNVLPSNNRNFTTEFNDVQRYDSYVVENLAKYSNYKSKNNAQDEKHIEESPHKQLQVRRKSHGDLLSSMEKQLMRLNAQVEIKNAENSLVKSKYNDLFATLQSRELELQDVVLRLEEKEILCEELQHRIAPHHHHHEGGQEREEMAKRIGMLEGRLMEEGRRFEVERRQWMEDKARVVRYQKQLQDNYMSLYKKSRDLEQENAVLAKKLRQFSTRQNQQQQIRHEKKGLSYPMDI